MFTVRCSITHSHISSAALYYIACIEITSNKLFKQNHRVTGKNMRELTDMLELVPLNFLDCYET
jgi:hypothetical protein